MIFDLTYNHPFYKLDGRIVGINDPECVHDLFCSERKLFFRTEISTTGTPVIVTQRGVARYVYDVAATMIRIHDAVRAGTITEDQSTFLTVIVTATMSGAYWDINWYFESDRLIPNCPYQMINIDYVLWHFCTHISHGEIMRPNNIYCDRNEIDDADSAVTIPFEIVDWEELFSDDEDCGETEEAAKLLLDIGEIYDTNGETGSIGEI